MIETVIEKITPAMAEQMLKHNKSNRTLRKNKVHSYALQMQAGFWAADSNDAILISTDGELLNGQHRLNAVIEAGIPVKMAVRYGVDKSIFKVLDQGAARSASDLYTRTIPNKASAIGGARMMAALRHGTSLTLAVHGRMQNGAAVPNEWIFDEIEDHLEDYNSASKYVEKVYRCLGQGGKSTMFFVIMLTKYVGTGDELYEFLDDVTDRRPESDAAIMMKTTLLQRYAKKTRTTPKDFVGIVLYAYDKYRRNAPIAMIKITEAIRVFEQYEALARMKYEMKVGA